MYTYEAIEEMMTPRGVAWSAHIRDEYNNIICFVYNGGDGACNDYQFASNEAESKFTTWAKETYPNAFEPLDFAVDQLWEGELVNG